MKLNDTVVIVTGAGSGIGKASAIHFARHGAKVGVLNHNPEETRKTVGEIESAGGEAIALIADVSRSDQMDKAVQTTLSTFGRLDVLFANAGINGVWAPIEEIKDDEWNKTIDTNLKGTFLSIRAVVPAMKKNGKGSILVCSSINGTRTFSNTGATVYSVSKAGQLAMVKMLALELARFNIRVNCICPGSVETNIDENTEERHTETVKIDATFEVNVPLHDKPASPYDVAELALFLASDSSKHITGTPVWIDGGQSLMR
jgi:NAD(P)-dependent dehydrogenase (short-subunit alcohol dehydrogenase family)